MNRPGHTIKEDTISGTLFAKSCKIAYLGNSVTVQKDGYRGILHEKLCVLTGQAHTAINAALGGIGSLATCFLVPDLVLRHKPDICFVECATADIGGSTPLWQTGAAVEGILRQLLAAKIKVCVLNISRSADILNDPAKVIPVYEKVAAYYRIPSISFNNFWGETLVHNDSPLLYDGIHTNASGAEWIAGQVTAWIESGSADLISSNNKELLFPGAYQYPDIVPATEQMIKGKGRSAKFRFALPFVEIIPGNEITYTISSGELVAILVIANEESGVVELRYGNESTFVQLYDKWCSKERLQAILLETPLRNAAVKLLIPDRDWAERGANTTTNAFQKKAASLKVAGFMINRFNDNYDRHTLWRQNRSRL